MRIVYMGTGEIGLPSLRFLLEDCPGTEVAGVFTQPDKKIGRKQQLRPPEVKTLALAAGVPVFQPERLRGNGEALEALRSLRADLGVVMAYGQILPDEVIGAPRLGCVNLHASLLPRHRGASPIQAAIREGNRESGLTLMRVAPKLDAGDMLLKRAVPIGPEDTGGILHDRLAELGPGLLAEGLPLLESGKTDPEPQDGSLATYAGKLLREDGEIDWARPAAEIERAVRAYDPWPGTWTTVPAGEKGGTRRLKLFPHAEEIPSPAPGREDPPGTVGESGSGLLVACGGGTWLRFRGDGQMEGKKRVPLDELLRGRAIEPGTRLQSSSPAGPAS